MTSRLINILLVILKLSIAACRPSKSSSSSSNTSSSSTSGGKKTKQGRSWVGVVSREEAASLDYSSAPPVNGVDSAEPAVDVSQFLNL